MTERLTILSESDGPDTPPAEEPGLPGELLLERLERAVMLSLARMGDSHLVVPLASAGLKAEIATRRLFERAITQLWHAYQLPTRRELLTLSEQLSALRFRVAALEQTQASKTRR